MQPLEPRLMLSAGVVPQVDPMPDLVVTLQGVQAPDIIVPGDKLSFSITIHNESNVAAQGMLDVELFLSTDDGLDDGDLRIWSLLDRPVNLAGGATLNVPVKVTAREVDPGDYHVIARASGIADAATFNNTDGLGPRQFALQFGQVGSRSNVKLVTQDPDGTIVTLQLKGPGTGEIVMGDGMPSLLVTGTTLASKLSMKTSGGEEPGVNLLNVHATDSLGQLAAPTLNLYGDATFDGALAKLDLGNLNQSPDRLLAAADDVEVQADWAVLHWISIAGQGESDPMVDLRLGRVADLRLICEQPIKSLTLVDWVEDLEGDDLIQAPSIAKAAVTGQSGPVVGDLAASLRTMALGKLTVAGELLGDVEVEGDVGTLQAASIFGEVNITGNAKSIRTLQDHMGLLKPEESRGSLAIGGTTKLRTASQQVTLHDAQVFFGGREMYDLADLLLFKDIGRSWNYQTTIRNAVSFNGTVQQQVSANRPQVGNFITYLVEEESEHTSGLYYWGHEEGDTYLARRNLYDEVATMEYTYASMLLCDSTLTLGQTLSDESAMSIGITVPMVDMDGLIFGNASAHTTLLGHELITVPGGTFLAAKLLVVVDMAVSGEVTAMDQTATLELEGTDTATIWAHPDIGIIQLQENLSLTARIVGGPSGHLGYTELRRLSSWSNPN
jgi:hypothetical protein